jgi:N-acetylmuramoyl-L-alanine amidase
MLDHRKPLGATTRCAALLTLFAAVLALGCRGEAPTVAAAATLPVATATPAPPTLASTSTPLPTATAQPTATITPEPTPVQRALTVAVDPGHGGYDLGARRFDDQGEMVYHESTVNLELGLLVRDELLARGFDVYMTRETDTLVNAEEVDTSGDGAFEYTLDETQARVDAINASGADLILSLHHNAYLDASGQSVADVGGIQTYYCADRPYGEDSLRFALLVHEALIGAIRAYGYDITDRGVLDDYSLVTPDSPGLHLILLGPVSARIVRASEVPGALSEPAFITHAVEGELIREPEFLARLAVAYGDAVEAYVEGLTP